ncbi:MAG: Methylase involved in ubiquinone/menaquinone biosynthesis [Candidatus Roizmanbacteria bacterium GW2011_GWA2_34_18]|uniref:Methylase involved in ubiquinone/menaquinone biosynthesis n=1 Tax=Candidatus Roizmanbacteria bacterium GW2011_GWA2_34_18 TaxID=1618477 RepID=A0A0G0B9E9_9BACT|nr:MAG: Methylase involved in ubiquinone/menaquinone biosynthesis [Candidatus Roizmanbacteria bacterium GW2011_GWA2_34_18]
MSVAERYHAEIGLRPAKYELPRRFASLKNFLKADVHRGHPSDNFHRSPIGERFKAEIKPNLSEDLASRAEQVFTGVLALRNYRVSLGEDGLQVPDADTIQKWVQQLIRPEEFPMFVPPAFSGWVERLTDQPIPHIAQANQFIAERITGHLKKRGLKKVKGVDLGAGTGATMIAVSESLHEQGIEVDLKGVDLTPKLAKIARARTGKEVDVANALDWLEKQEDGSLDFITMVYAIHHLHYSEQLKLQQLALKKLKKYGIFAIADPTGRSKFNLQNLDINEPEAVMACFRPDVDEVIESLERFHVVTKNETPGKMLVNSFGVESDMNGDVLDQGTLGYALLAVKV